MGRGQEMPFIFIDATNETGKDALVFGLLPPLHRLTPTGLVLMEVRADSNEQ